MKRLLHPVLGMGSALHRFPEERNLSKNDVDQHSNGTFGA